MRQGSESSQVSDMLYLLPCPLRLPSRPKGDRFEVVAGARRFRAAQIADLADVPTLEVQIIENSQRQDVHPYEEAAGYQRLLDLPGYDVAALASKCGRSQSHICAVVVASAIFSNLDC